MVVEWGVGGIEWFYTQISQWLYEDRGRPLQCGTGYRISTNKKIRRNGRYLTL